MILIYTPRINQRKRYIFDLILYQLCGFEYDISDNLENYLNFRGAKINYSTLPIADDELFIYSNDLLNEKSVKPQKTEPFIYKGVNVIFPVNNKKSAFPFDIFSAAFYFVSRYEEYLPYIKDTHGRFEAEQSLAYKNNFLEKPVVNYYAILFGEILKRNYSFLKPTRINKFRFIPTYDIDLAYEYIGKGFFRTVAGYVKSVIDFDFKKVIERSKVISGMQTDPFDTYSFQLDLQRISGIKPYYFFLVADYGLKDKNPSVYNTAYRKLIKQIGDYAIAGIHPSFASNKYPEKINQEKKRLSSLLIREVKYSRQHYLIIELPDTYQRLIDAGITKDFTMGYATNIGFRAGICNPFLFYNLKTETITNLLVYPLAVMDGTLKEYMKLNIENASVKVKNMIDEIESVNGIFITLWHNQSLCHNSEWNDWREFYAEIYNYAAEKHLRSNSDKY